MKNGRSVISICLLSMLCLSIISGAAAAKNNKENSKGAQGQYPIELKIDYGDYNTESSWFRPYIVRNLEGGSYAWTVIGTVWFTRASGKWPGGYWRGGGYAPPIHRLDLPIYKSPYITQVQLHMTAVRLPGSIQSPPTIVNGNKDKYKVEFTQDIIIKDNVIIKNEITKY
jgi:hypothetical protein